MKVLKNISCPWCKGTRKIKRSQEDCPGCNGTGKYYIWAKQ